MITDHRLSSKNLKIITSTKRVDIEIILRAAIKTLLNLTRREERMRATFC